MTIPSLIQILLLFYLLSISISLCFSVDGVSAQRIIDLTMPDIRPLADDSYFCTAKRLNPQKTEYIVSYKPNANATKVHHIIIYGCTSPGRMRRDSPRYVWDCGEMSRSETSNGNNNELTLYETGPVCGTDSKATILYAWALDAPALELPQGVGFKVGGPENPIKYLVLQVHYGHTQAFRRNPRLLDDSGILLETVDGGIDKLAGIYLMLSYGYVLPGFSKHLLECRINESPTKVIHPFRFRTHTHKLGLKVAAYLSSNSGRSNFLIGEHNPQEPQMFYPVQNKSIEVRGGDFIHGFCEYHNPYYHNVNIAGTGKDEMCNFYLMYWTHGHELLRDQDCLTYNPHWPINSLFSLTQLVSISPFEFAIHPSNNKKFYVSISLSSVNCN